MKIIENSQNNQNELLDHIFKKQTENIVQAIEIASNQSNTNVLDLKNILFQQSHKTDEIFFKLSAIEKITNNIYNQKNELLANISKNHDSIINNQNKFYEKLTSSMQDLQVNTQSIENMILNIQNMKNDSNLNNDQKHCVVHIENLFKHYSELLNNSITNEKNDLYLMLSEEIEELKTEMIDLKDQANITNENITEANKTLNSNQNMLKQLIFGHHFLPSLFIIEKDESKKHLLGISYILKVPMKLTFCCPITLKRGNSYEINKTKKWVKKIIPVLQVSIIMLKIAASVYGIPIPIPTDFNAYITSNDLQSCFDATDFNLQQQIDDKIIELKNENKSDFNTKMNSFINQNIGVISEENFWSIRKTICAIENENLISSWEPKNTGLKKIISNNDGTIAWIVNDSKIIQNFHENGKNAIKMI